MKEQLKTIYRTAARLLPVGLKKRIFLDIARDLGISKISVFGESGEILGDVSDKTIFRKYIMEGTWSSGVVTAIKQFFEAEGGGTFFDIGANIGLTTVPVAANPKVTCFAFEPEPNNYLALQHNISTNCRMKNVKLFNLALFDKDTTLQFELASHNSGDHRIRINRLEPSSVEFGEAERQVITVRGGRLDALISGGNLAMPICTKMDTQGAEHQIYVGGRSILSSSKMLISEFWPYGLKRMGGDPDALLQMFKEDFAVGSIQQDEHHFAESPMMPMSEVVVRLAEIVGRAGPRDWVDLLMFK